MIVESRRRRTMALFAERRDWLDAAVAMKARNTFPPNNSVRCSIVLQLPAFGTATTVGTHSLTKSGQGDTSNATGTTQKFPETRRQSSIPIPGKRLRLWMQPVFFLRCNLPEFFAYCDTGGPSVQLCVTELEGVNLAEPLGFGWSNQINCTGGTLAFDLWIEATGCNRSASTGHTIGTVLINTDSSTIEVGLSDDTFDMGASHVYVGESSIPSLNGTLSISPENSFQTSWYSPHIRSAKIQVNSGIHSGDDVIVHVDVCPAPFNAPIPVPSQSLSPSRLPGLPLCPIQPEAGFSVLPLASTSAPSSTLSPAQSTNEHGRLSDVTMGIGAFSVALHGLLTPVRLSM